MLQRAASNAYSWWWAGHIRTKQTKWLEQSLQDVEENVQDMLKIIEQEGDSFAKRAEMYYKKRPELINLVEENYRAYRALADRYDHLSTDLQNANNTIASVFPEQAELVMDEEEDDDAPLRVPSILSQQASTDSVPTPPKYPRKHLKDILNSASEDLQTKNSSNSDKTALKSGLTKSEAFEEIDKLQKEILALQTVKEFVKSSYENGLAKYREIENRVSELQARVFSLQDEFSTGKVIEDDEARTLMVEAALRSCEEALSQLQEKQERSTDEAREEFKRVEFAREKLKSLREKFLPDLKVNKEKSNVKDEAMNVTGNQQGLASAEDSIIRERQELDELREKIGSHFDMGSRESLTVTEMVEKIDELVSKVINLETAISSQTALINRLKTDSEDLQAQIRTLEDDKATLMDGTSTLTNKLSSLEEELNRLQDLNQNFENENNHLRAYFTEARCSIDHLSEKLHSLKPDEDLESMDLLHEEDYCSSFGVKTPEMSEKHFYLRRLGDGSTSAKQMGKVGNETKTKDYDPKQMLVNGSVDTDGIFFTEYTAMIRNFKDAKKKINDLERENQEILFEKTAEITQLKSDVAKRDVTIRCLLQKLKLLQENFNENEEFKEESEDNNLKLILLDQRQIISPIEDKLRMKIDALLDDNLDFWFKFSTSFHQIQKFKIGFEDLQAEILKVKEKEKESGIVEIKSDLRPIYKHLREIETEITIWAKQSALLKDDLQERYSSLCKIETEITKALKKDEEKDFNGHEAATFQGEILNMKQDCYKVRIELQAGLEHVTTLKHEIEKTFTKLDEDFKIIESNDNNHSQARNSIRRARIPLRTFIFGTKSKKRTSLFSYIHHRRKHV